MKALVSYLIIAILAVLLASCAPDPRFSQPNVVTIAGQNGPELAPATPSPIATTAPGTLPPAPVSPVASPTQQIFVDVVTPASPPAGQGGNCVVVHESIVSFGDQEISSANNWLRVQLWSNGTPEFESVLKPGRYLIYGKVAGMVWEFSPSCTEAEMWADADASYQRRLAARVNTGGVVSLQQFIDSGWLEIVFQENGATTVVPVTATAQPTTALTNTTPISATQVPVHPTAPTTAAPQAGCPDAIQLGNADDQNITVPQGHTYTIESWGHTEGVNGLVIFAEGMTILGFKGALWDYACPFDAVVQKESARNPIVFN